MIETGARRPAAVPLNKVLRIIDSASRSQRTRSVWACDCMGCGRGGCSFVPVYLVFPYLNNHFYYYFYYNRNCCCVRPPDRLWFSASECLLPTTTTWQSKRTALDYCCPVLAVNKSEKRWHFKFLLNGGGGGAVGRGSMAKGNIKEQNARQKK